MTCFATVLVLKISAKSLDYSLFRVAKELLYIPLDYEHKYKAKAFIDMFLYRFAKAPASLLLKGLLLIFGAGHLSVFFGAILAVTVLWITAVLELTRLRRSASGTRVGSTKAPP